MIRRGVARRIGTPRVMMALLPNGRRFSCGERAPSQNPLPRGALHFKVDITDETVRPLLPRVRVLIVPPFL